MLSSPARRCMRAAATRSFQTPAYLSSIRQFQTTSIRCKDDAFDPSKTRPEEQKEGAKEEAKEANLGNSADPAGEYANKQNDPQKGGPQGSKAEDGAGAQQRDGQSGGGNSKNKNKM